MASWIKCGNLLGTSLVAWLVALAPVGNLGKIASHVIAFATCGISIKESEKLIHQSCQQRAIKVMQQELQDTQIALETQAQELALHESYGVSHPSYSPEVLDDLIQTLESNYSNSSASPSDEVTVSSYQQLALAVKALLETGTPESHIIKNVLKMGGRNYQRGKELLQQLLSEN